MQGGNNFIKNMEKQAVRKNLGGLFYKLGMEKAVREAGKKWKADNCKYN